MPVRFAYVSDGIYRGGAPSANDLNILINIYGVKHIISLDGTIGAEISNIIKELGVEHTIIPIGGRDSISVINFLKHNIAQMLLDIQPVYIHCRHGSDRTGMAIAFHRIQNEGWTPTDALEEAKKFGFGQKLDPDTAQIYIDAILSNLDNNQSIDGDITSMMRDQFGMGNNPPAYSPQQSFSVPDDYKYIGPDELLSNNQTGRENRKRNMKRVLLEVLVPDDSWQDMPQVGGRDPGSNPYGVGPTETSVFFDI